MKRLMMIAGASLLGAGVARADTEATPLDALDPVRVVSPLTLVQGDGVKIGEGTAFYPQVGLETGYESNTFYQADNPTGAGILRLLAVAGIGSLSPSRLGGSQTGEVNFEANAYAAYDQYLSGNNSVSDQSGLGLGFHGNVLVHPEGTVSFYANDGYDRILRPNNFESTSNATRDINTALLRLDIHPEARRLGGSIAYTNTIDVFENNSQYPDRVLNTLTGMLSYKLFPLTTARLTVSGSYNTGIGSADKVTSYPIIAKLGLSTALTVNTSLLAEGGYTQGFYSSGPDYQSFTGDVYFEYRYSDLSAMRLLYAYNHADSVNANFYSEHVFQGWLEHKVERFGVYLSPEARLREYQGLNPPLMGPIVRNDVIVAAALGLRYQFRNWVNASVQYRIVDDSTDYRYTSGASMLDPSYLRHEVFAGVRLAY